MDVSVIVATLDAARFLPAALASVRAQRDVSLDLIVVDAHSTDGTPEIARAFGARLVVQEGLGLAAAWNTGIAEARAPLIAFLDSDDQWVENTMAERIQTVRSAPVPRMSVGRVRHFLEPGTAMPRSLDPGLFMTERLAPIPGTLIVPMKIFSEVGSFDPNYELAHDSDWIGRAIATGHHPDPVDRLVLLKRVHGGNRSRRADENTRELLRTLRSKMAKSRLTPYGGAG